MRKQIEKYLVVVILTLLFLTMVCWFANLHKAEAKQSTDYMLTDF